MPKNENAAPSVSSADARFGANRRFKRPGWPTGPKRTMGRHGLRKTFWNARRDWIVEMAIRGYSCKAIAEKVNLSEETVKTQLETAAHDPETIERVRQRLSNSLRKVPILYETILDADVEQLAKHSKGWALKKAVADTLGQGLGVLRNETKTTATRLNLHAYHEQRKQLRGETIDAETREIDPDPAYLLPASGLSEGDGDAPRRYRQDVDGSDAGSGAPEGAQRFADDE